MGGIVARQSYFLDVASEEIACSSGVLLTDDNIKTLSVRYDIEDFRRLERTERETRMRAEEFEQAVLDIRKAIGNLPDAKMGQFVLLDVVRALHDKGTDTTKIGEAYITVSKSGKHKSIGKEAMEEIISISGQNPLHVLEFLGAFGEMQRRQLFHYRRVTAKNWDGAISLDRLFQGEHIPDDPSVYLDQRYIDYLAKNNEEMGRIHWRNFERLTTEFFRRQQKSALESCVQASSVTFAQATLARKASLRNPTQCSTLDRTRLADVAVSSFFGPRAPEEALIRLAVQ